MPLQQRALDNNSEGAASGKGGGLGLVVGLHRLMSLMNCRTIRYLSWIHRQGDKIAKGDKENSMTEAPLGTNGLCE